MLLHEVVLGVQPRKSAPPDPRCGSGRPTSHEISPQLGKTEVSALWALVRRIPSATARQPARYLRHGERCEAGAQDPSGLIAHATGNSLSSGSKGRYEYSVGRRAPDSTARPP